MLIPLPQFRGDKDVLSSGHAPSESPLERISDGSLVLVHVCRVNVPVAGTQSRLDCHLHLPRPGQPRAEGRDQGSPADNVKFIETWDTG